MRTLENRITICSIPRGQANETAYGGKEVIHLVGVQKSGKISPLLVYECMAVLHSTVHTYLCTHTYALQKPVDYHAVITVVLYSAPLRKSTQERKSLSCSLASSSRLDAKLHDSQ